MDIKDLLKLQNDITKKEQLLEYLLFMVRSTTFTVKEKSSLLDTVNELRKTVTQLKKALENNLK